MINGLREGPPGLWARLAFWEWREADVLLEELSGADF